MRPYLNEAELHRRRLRWSHVALGMLLISPVPLFAQVDSGVVTAIMNSGDQIQGTIEQVSSDGFQIRSETKLCELSNNDVSEIRFNGLPPDRMAARFGVQLIDGSQLQVNEILINANSAELKLATGEIIEVETRKVARIRDASEDAESASGQNWDAAEQLEEFSKDAIVLKRDGSLQNIEGMIGSVNNQTVQFTIGERTVDVDMERVFALVYFRAARGELVPPMCRIMLNDGTIFNVKQWSMLPNANGRLRLTTSSDADITLTARHVWRIDLSMGREVYLDQLGPTTNQWSPLFANEATVEALRRLRIAKANKSFDNQPLELEFVDTTKGSRERKSFDHGFAIQGGGKLTFLLNGNYRQLTGWVGFDPQASDQGVVALVMRLDGKVVFDEPLAKSEMDNPLRISLDVKDAKRVVIQVDYHDGRSVGDRVHLVDLKATK